MQNETEKPQNEDDLDDSVTYEFIQEMAKTMGQGDRNHDMNVIMILFQVTPCNYINLLSRKFAISKLYLYLVLNDLF